jgi:two-component system, OmpR family, response regulator
MKILVVEDEHRIAQTIKKGLELEHHVVDLAYTGSDGYDLASSEEYELLILDRMLPEMDGVTLCKTLRQEQNHVPILLLTAKSQIEDKVEGLDAGADDYLTKPFSFEELLARVRALTRRPKKALSAILSVEDLQLSPATFEVTRAGKKVELSSKEFALLEYLLRHAKKIVSKQQIINNVWNYDSNVLPNTVEVYIKNLRNKIDVPFKEQKPLIITVRGFGYRIGA